MPCIVTSPILLFGIPPKAPTMSFGAFDDASVWDSVSSTMPRQPVPPMQEAGKPTKGLVVGKADATA